MNPVIVEERVAAAKHVEVFMAENYSRTTVYVPIANTTEQQKRGVQPKKGWYLYDFDRLKTADRLIVLMLDGWEDSIGVALEIAFALGKGLGISYYTLEETHIRRSSILARKKGSRDSPAKLSPVLHCLFYRRAGHTSRRKQVKKSWIHPEEIYLADHLNPRQLNQGFIESLVESMQSQGFLPSYPVKVFESDSLACVETELPYTCVSGMHRTTAAQLAKIDEILCEVHTGDDDAFIEMMMTDNFEYDPAQNAELGQIFSQREKRNACKHLLFIPKFLRMTNSALAETWHTSEVNIRRWRKEVASSIDEGITVVLRDKGVSLDRLPELQEILVQS